MYYLAPDFCDFFLGTLLCCTAPLMTCYAMRGILDQIGAVESVKAASDIVESSVLFPGLFSNRVPSAPLPDLGYRMRLCQEPFGRSTKT